MSAERQADWLSIRDALARILEAVHPLEAEEVRLEDAFGRSLAEPVLSPIDQPPWDNSAMDGFAARSDDVRGASPETPRRLRIVESVAAGEFPTRPIGPGEATRVMTGAPIPEGADGVIRIEHARATATHAEIFDDADAGRNVRPRGEDLTRGAEVLRKGSLLRAGEIGVLATVGRQPVKVVRRARVGLLSTGDELIGIDQFDAVLAGRRIVDSNSYALSAAVLSAGATPVRLGIARDEAASLEQHLAPALQLDALITTAGASVGEHDLVKNVLERLGMRTLFWRVRIRPGSPFSFGLISRYGERDLPVFGLPGNPVSALVTFEVLVKPALRKMHGRAQLHARTLMVRAAERIRSPAGLVRFLRVTLERQGTGVIARLTGNQGSGILSSVARADALLVVPIDVDTLERGEEAVALPLATPDDAQDNIGF
jgi:molybdopterin molybdotransferase